MPGEFAREKTAIERHIDRLQLVIRDLDCRDVEQAKTDLRQAISGLYMVEHEIKLDESRNAYHAADNHRRSAELEVAEAQSPPRLKLQA